MISYLMIIESLVELKNLNTVITSSISGKMGSFDTLYASTKNSIDFTHKSGIVDLHSLKIKFYIP